MFDSLTLYNGCFSSLVFHSGINAELAPSPTFASLFIVCNIDISMLFYRPDIFDCRVNKSYYFAV